MFTLLYCRVRNCSGPHALRSYMTYRKAAFDKEDQAPRKCGTLAENGQNVFAWHIACIHIQLRCIRDISSINAMNAECVCITDAGKVRDKSCAAATQNLYTWFTIVQCTSREMFTHDGPVHIVGDVCTCSPIGIRNCMLIRHVLSVSHGLMTSLMKQHASALWRSIQPFCQDAGVAHMPWQHLLMHVRFVHSCFHCTRLTHSQPGLHGWSLLVQHEASIASHNATQHAILQIHDILSRLARLAVLPETHARCSITT